LESILQAAITEQRFLEAVLRTSVEFEYVIPWKAGYGPPCLYTLRKSNLSTLRGQGSTSTARPQRSHFPFPV